MATETVSTTGELCLDRNIKITKEYVLEANWELRFAVSASERYAAEKNTIEVELKSGSAEVFGEKLELNKKYKYLEGAHHEFTIFACEVSTLSLTGCEFDHGKCRVLKESPIVKYLKFNSEIDEMRETAQETKTQGPITVVTGNGGKSKICRILLNYALRSGYQPIYVDLNVGYKSYTIPGAMSAVKIDAPILMNEGFPPASILVHYGDVGPANKKHELKACVETVAEKTMGRLVGEDESAWASGLIVKANGFTKGAGFKQLLENIKIFNATTVLVVEENELFTDLRRDLRPSISVTLVPGFVKKVSKSGAKCDNKKNFRIREYFYGTKDNPATPYSIKVKYNKARIFRVGPGRELKLYPYKPELRMVHHLLALSRANYPENALHQDVIGYVCVTEVNAEERTLTLLSTQPEPLPNTILLFSNVKFLENATKKEKLS